MGKKLASVFFTGTADVATPARLNATPTPAAGPAPTNTPGRHYEGMGNATLRDRSTLITLTGLVATISGQTGSLPRPASIREGSFRANGSPCSPYCLTVRGSVTAGRFIYDAPSGSVTRGAITPVNIKVSISSTGPFACRFTVSGLASFSYTADRVLTVNPEEGAGGLVVNSAVDGALIRAGDPVEWTARNAIPGCLSG